MTKVFVSFCLFCLCACAFGRSLLRATYNGCATHVKVSYVDSPSTSGEYFFCSMWSTTQYFKFVRDDGYQTLYRCDLRENRKCYQKIVDPKGNPSCQDTLDSRPYAPSFSDYIYYDETLYPEPAECPDPILSDCQKYCDIDSPNDCVIVDSNGFFAQNRRGSNFTFYDPPSMEVFADKKCDGTTTVDTPPDFCAAVKVFVPELPGCLYHYKVGSDEYYGMVGVGTSSPQYLKRIRTGAQSVETVIARCDSHGSDCYVKKVTSADTCWFGSDYIYNYAPIPAGPMLYDSASYPQPADCPDGTHTCLKYCWDTQEYDCIIVDAVGRLVNNGGENYTYFDNDLPTMETFDFVKCDGTPPSLPPLVDRCVVEETFTPKFPCTFNVSVKNSTTDIKLSGIYVDDSLEQLVLKMEEDSLSYLFRCDQQNPFEMCFSQTSDSDNPCLEKYITISDISVIISGLFSTQSFTYNKTAYPVDAECPDGSDGCKQYCTFDGKCYLVNSADYIVQDPSLTNWTFSDEFSFDAFEVDSCKTPSTHIPAPSAELCYKPSPSSDPSGQSSIHPVSPVSPTPASPSSVLSRASIVKSTFTFVAIAVALALF